MQGKTVVLGVSGGIAAYKACDLASKLTQAGATVRVVMTQSAMRFVSPLTFQALTHQPVATSLWPDNDGRAADVGVYAAMPHIGLADSADAVLIAPASADTLARLAAGMSDDLLTTICLATPAPVLLAPAMNPRMLVHPATQRNLQTLQTLGYKIIDPESGRMACEHVGSGRLPTTDVLMSALRDVLAPIKQDLRSQHILVTAGGTREPIDPVRFIGNRSSGKMGYAIAEECARRGARVVLISGPTNLPTPPSVELVRVQTTQEMLDAVLARESKARCNAFISAAAPADFRVAEVSPSKIKKSGDGARALELIANPDILAAFRAQSRRGQKAIGFAAETGDPTLEARRKLEAKHLDAIVANDVTQDGAGFDVDTNRVIWITQDETEAWPLMSKREVAARLCDKLVGMLPPPPLPIAFEPTREEAEVWHYSDDDLRAQTLQSPIDASEETAELREWLNDERETQPK